jgi:hypothetical protein
MIPHATLNTVILPPKWWVYFRRFDYKEMLWYRARHLVLADSGREALAWVRKHEWRNRISEMLVVPDSNSVRE